MHSNNDVDFTIAETLTSLLSHRHPVSSPSSSSNFDQQSDTIHQHRAELSSNHFEHVINQLDLSWLDTLTEGVEYNGHGQEQTLTATTATTTATTIHPISTYNHNATTIRFPSSSHTQHPILTATTTPRHRHCQSSIIKTLIGRTTSTIVNSDTSLPTPITTTSTTPPPSFIIRPLALNQRLPTSFSKQALKPQDELSEYFNLNDHHFSDSATSNSHEQTDEYCILIQGLVDQFGRRIALLKDNRGWTLGHYAALYGSVATIHVLITSFGEEADGGMKEQVLNQLDTHGYTPLSLACKYGHIDVVRILLDEVGYQFNHPCTDPLRLAIESGHISTIQLLLSCFTNHPTIKIPPSWDSPLFITISCLDHPPHLTTDLINFFIDNGYSILDQDTTGSTPLIRACQLKRPLNVVKDLLMHPRNIRSLSDRSDGEDDEQEENCEGRKKRGSWNSGGGMALDTIQVEALSATDRIYGRTALHWAASTGDTETAKLLINLGSRLECRDLRGCTPSLVAGHEGRSNMVKFLLSMGAKKNVEDYEGRRVEGLLTEHANH